MYEESIFDLIMDYRVCAKCSASMFSLEISVLGFPTSGKKSSKKKYFFVKIFFP